MAQQARRPGRLIILKLGDKGLPVIWLQERLHSLGYDVGAIDGIYGFLTEECVRSLERDFGLAVDGMAGPRVINLLQDSEIGAHRIVHLVERDIALAEIADKYGIAKEAIWLWNRGLRGKERIEGGTRLALHRRTIWGVVLGEMLPGAKYPWQDVLPQLSGLLLYSFSLSNSGEVEGHIPENIYETAKANQIKVIPVISNRHRETYDESAVHMLLRQGNARRMLLDTVKDLVKDSLVYGIALDIQGVCMGYGRRFGALVGTLRELVQRHGKKLYTTLRPQGDDRRLLPRHVDPRVWVSLPHRVILQLAWEYSSKGPGPRLGMEWLKSQLGKVAGYIPCWKLIVILPVNGIAWKMNDSKKDYAYLTYDDVRKIAYSKQAKVKWDEQERIPYYDYVDQGDCFRVWFENRDSIDTKLRWLSRQHLSGLAVMPMGSEDSRIWKELHKHFIKAEYSG